ncbi:MAG: ABC transporter ATP-binding protein/permease [Nanoarchaeota archaeon]|nr:ABC transporter ATP-binding protein/permease [Nanoarchaeota archaeon]
MKKKGEYPWKQYFIDYWYLLEGNRPKFIFFTILRSASQFISFIIAYLFGKIIDFLTKYSTTGAPLTELYTYITLIGVLGAFTVWLRMFSKKGLKVIGTKIRKKSRLLALNKLILADMGWHEKENTGSKIQKINTGSDSVYESIQLFSNAGISIIIDFISSIIIFFFIDFRYLLFSLIFVVVYLLGEYYFNRKLDYLATELNKVRERLSGKIHESVSNILSIKSLGMGKSIHKKTESEEEKYYKTWEKRLDLHNLHFKTVKTFSAIMVALFILILSFDVIGGLITLGSIYVFYNYFEKLRSAMGSLTDQSSNFVNVKSGFGRLMVILGLDTNDKIELKDFPKGWKVIEFKNVSFKYKNKEVLKNFNLKIVRNSRIGLVGRSGSGKSTIVKLLIGLYKPYKGKILVDGKNINEFSSISLIKEISVVLQDSEVFNMSLYDNLALIQDEKNNDMIKKAIQISELKHLIKKLPKGMDTLIGEKGYKMSGGERQRLGIARALSKESSMIIFDEATSALDSKTEQKIQNALDTQLKNKTTIIIAHRLSTLKKVDKVIMMKNGKISESGTFDELVRLKGDFYKLYKIQMKKD